MLVVIMGVNRKLVVEIY